MWLLYEVFINKRCHIFDLQFWTSLYSLFTYLNITFEKLIYMYIKLRKFSLSRLPNFTNFILRFVIFVHLEGYQYPYRTVPTCLPKSNKNNEESLQSHFLAAKIFFASDHLIVLIHNNNRYKHRRKLKFAENHNFWAIVQPKINLIANGCWCLVVI